MVRGLRRLMVLCLISFSSHSLSQDCIGVVPAGSVHDFWMSVKAGSEKAAQELGLAIYFRGPKDESDIDAQRMIIDQVVKNRCIGLLLAPNSADRADDVARLKQLNIPTVYIDRDAGVSDVISVIATDNYHAGFLAGKKMAKKLGNQGKVALLRMEKGVVSTDDREQGFEDGATSSGLMIVEDSYLGLKIGDARKNAKEILAGKIQQLDGIFTPNESTTVAVLIALGSLKTPTDLVHIGFDSNKILVEALSDGRIYGLVIQQPYEMGYRGVYALYQTFLGNPFPKNIPTDSIFATQANMDQPKVRKALLMKYR